MAILKPRPKKNIYADAKSIINNFLIGLTLEEKEAFRNLFNKSATTYRFYRLMHHYALNKGDRVFSNLIENLEHFSYQDNLKTKIKTMLFDMLFPAIRESSILRGKPQEDVDKNIDIIVDDFINHIPKDEFIEELTSKLKSKIIIDKGEEIILSNGEDLNDTIHHFAMDLQGPNDELRFEEMFNLFMVIQDNPHKMYYARLWNKVINKFIDKFNIEMEYDEY